KDCSAVRERVIGRILGERRQPESRRDSPHSHRPKEPPAPVLSAHGYDAPCCETSYVTKTIGTVPSHVAQSVGQKSPRRSPSVSRRTLVLFRKGRDGSMA